MKSFPPESLLLKLRQLGWTRRRGLQVSATLCAWSSEAPSLSRHSCELPLSPQHAERLVAGYFWMPLWILYCSHRRSHSHHRHCPHDHRKPSSLESGFERCARARQSRGWHWTNARLRHHRRRWTRKPRALLRCPRFLRNEATLADCRRHHRRRSEAAEELGGCLSSWRLPRSWMSAAWRTETACRVK